MFSDIALYGTTAPDPVPSPSVKITDTFGQAFADLLVLPQPPAPQAANAVVDDIVPAALFAQCALPVHEVTARELPAQWAPVSREAATTGPAQLAALAESAATTVSMQGPLLDGSAAAPVAATGAEVSSPSTLDVSGIQSPEAPANSYEKRDSAEDIPAGTVIGLQSLPVPLPSPVPFPAVDVDPPSAAVDIDQEGVTVSSRTTSSADTVQGFVVEPVGHEISAAPGLPGELTDVSETSAARRDLVKNPDDLVKKPHDVLKKSSDVANKPDDRSNSTFIPRLTPLRSAEARGRLAALAALLAPVTEPERLSRYQEITRAPAAPAIQPGQPASAAFHAVTDERSGAFEPDAVVSKNGAPVVTSLPGVALARTTASHEVDVEGVRTASEASVSDSGSSSALLQTHTQKPLFSATRALEALQAPSRSAYEELPNEAGNARSIVQTLRLQASAGGGTAVMTLAPKYLGSVTVSLRVIDGGVTATLHADSAAVRTWLDSNVALLRDGLAEQGLRLEKVIVADAPEPRQNAEDQAREAHQRPPAFTRRPRRREQRTFDVTV